MFNRNYERIILFFAMIFALTSVTYVNANRQGGYEEKLNPDGTGWKVHWDWNEVETTHVVASMNKSTGKNYLCVPYTDVFQFASFSTSG